MQRCMYCAEMVSSVNSSLDQPASINSQFSSVDDLTRSLTTAGVRRSDYVNTSVIAL